jgi:hypothetical protein
MDERRAVEAAAGVIAVDGQTVAVVAVPVAHRPDFYAL